MAMMIRCCASRRWRLPKASCGYPCIGHEKLAALERLRDPEEDALTGRYSRQGLAKIKAKLDLRLRAVDIADDQLIEVNALIDATKRAGRDYEREPLPAHLEAAWPPALLKGVPGPQRAG